jgi:hypothetical protein
VNRRVLIIVLTASVLAAGALVTINLTRPQPDLAVEAEPEAPPPPPPAPPPVVETPAEPAPAPRPRAAPAPRPETAPAEASVELGTLQIDADVPGAQVFIDREYAGVVPVTVPNVTPGTHRLNVSAQGYEGIAETIEVAPGTRDMMVRFRVVRLDSAIDVVHRHRLGSCRGRLVATPQGLRYETTNKDDAFSAVLLDLDTFEVDYLEKNLRVQPRKGRRFDFTDPEGNADRLFVFHRDVEKAREQLRKGDPPAEPSPR